MARAWEPRERIALPDWCARELFLPAETGPNPGRMNLDRFPFLREPLAAAEDPETEEIVLCSATQIGKTTVLQAILAGLAALRPAPAMLCAPDQDATKKLRNKFYAMCDATPALREKVPPEHKRNMSQIDFGNSVCHLAWTGNPQRVAAESCRVVLVTETDRAHSAIHEGALHKLISERVKAWFNFLKVFEGTPTDEDSTIVGLYEQSDKCLFQVPCPHCGHFQPLRFFLHKEGEHAGCGGVDGLKDAEGNWRSADEVLDSAFYRCEKGCRIDQRDKDAMVRQGVWCPAGCEVGTDGAVTGTPTRSRRRRGFGGLCSLYADTITIGRMAAEYLDSRDKEEEMRNFINNWCGLKYKIRTKTPKGFEIHKRLRGSHPRGKVPSGAIFLTGAGDVHDDNSYWLVRGWGEGCTSWLVDWGICPVVVDAQGKLQLGSQLKPLDGLLINRRWPLVGENPNGETELGVVKVAIDCGHLPLLVHNFARQHHPELVLTVAGDAQPTQGIPYTFNRVDRNTRTNKPYPGGLKRWAINTDFYKTDIMGRWGAPLDEPGAWWLTDAPWDEAATYCRQITNEGVVMGTNRAGFPTRTWVILQSGVGNHLLDCEVYARAAADMVVQGNWQNVAARFKRPPQRQATREEERERERGGFIRKTGGGFIRGS